LISIIFCLINFLNTSIDSEQDSWQEIDDHQTEDKTNLISGSHYAVLGTEEDDDGDMLVRIKDVLGQESNNWVSPGTVSFHLNKNSFPSLNLQKASRLLQPAMLYSLLC
jgi:hypothetical protein